MAMEVTIARNTNPAVRRQWRAPVDTNDASHRTSAEAAMVRASHRPPS